MNEGLRIRAIGRFLPPGRCDTSAQAATLAVAPSVLENKLGFRQRAVKETHGTTDLAEQAVRALLNQHPELPTEEIGLLCVVTQNPDRRIPHTAATLHERVSLPRSCMTFDLSQGCAGFVHGLVTVISLAAHLGIRRALLVTADPYSDIIDPSDWQTALIFGDAATATWLDVEGPGYVTEAADFGTSPGTSDVLRCADRFRMNGREVYLHASREVPRSIRSVLRRAQIGDEDIATYLLHPGSLGMLRQLRTLLALDETRCPFEATGYGNTVSSSIPLMLADRLTGEQPLVILSGFGVGFTWGTCLLRWVPEQPHRRAARPEEKDSEAPATNDTTTAT